MIKAIIFDFDGTILETETPVFQAWDELYQSVGFRLALSDWVQIIGTNENYFDPAADLEGKAGRKLDWEDLNKRRLARERSLILELPVLPGVREYLQAAGRLGLKVAVASSSTKSWVEGHLLRLGLLENFDCLLTRDDVRRTKPAPDLFLAAVQSLGVLPREALVIEDSPNGVAAAQRAGLPVVAVPNKITRSLPMNGALLVLESLESLPLEDLLRQVEELLG